MQTWSTRIFIAFALLALTGTTQAQPELLTLSGDLSPIHDPVIIREGDTYYVFATNRFQGKHGPMFCSQNLLEWKFCGNVFEDIPKWAQEEVPGTRGMWAPDISYVHDEYRLYYSVSTFGSNHSVIGLITNKTLNPASPDYHWVDQGKVIGSVKTDDFNAIDANLFVDNDGTHWLSFGSFWGGIKMIKLDPTTGKASTEDTQVYSLASRRPMQPPAIEAPFIVRQDGHYYLFVSFDFCCRGKDSTYNVVVGRSDSITGPYVDKDGRPMMEGGGTRLTEGTALWHGPGHPGILREEGRDLFVFHAYHAETGRPHLQISTMTWEDGWPRVAGLPKEKAEPAAKELR